jgi:predicted metal-dependent hydrolase
VAERADAPDGTARLAACVELFNAGRYHDAHEALEELWLATEGPDSDFYKGLIQAAICLHHLARGNLDGARGLYRGHRRYLAAYLPEHLGIDVARFLADMQRYLEPVLRGEPMLRAAPGAEAARERSAAPRLQSSGSSSAPSPSPSSM